MLKKGGVAGTIPVLAQHAVSEGPRWMRAVGIVPATPCEVTARCGLAWAKARLGAPGWRVRSPAFLSILRAVLLLS